MSDELVERVTRAMCGSIGVCFKSCGTEPCEMAEEEYGKEARAAIAVVLEEAAKACDEIEAAEHRKWKQHADMMAQGASDGAGDCAAAIRALVKGPTNPGPASSSDS